MNPQNFDEFIAQVLGQWMDNLTRKLDAAIVAEQLVNTGALFGSLKSKVLGSVVGITAMAQLDFRMYGRFLDMKKFGRILPNTNETNRAVTGVARNRGRSWYAKTVWKQKYVLADTLLKDIGKMSSKEFLNWVKN
jgi:hypothetical protein